MPKIRMIVANYQGEDPAGAMKAVLDGFFLEGPTEAGKPVARSIPGVPDEMYFDAWNGEIKCRETGKELGTDVTLMYLGAVEKFLMELQGMTNPKPNADGETDAK